METPPPQGQRFSQVYLQRKDLLPDSERMRHRLALTISDLGDQETRSRLGSQIQRKQGVNLGEAKWEFQWVRILAAMELRDVLDAITTIHDSLTHHDTARQAATRQAFIAACRLIFSEEGVRYRIDDHGGVHFTVDQEFESSRVSTISTLSQPRYNGVRSLFEQAYVALDGVPPDGKLAIRTAFFAAEGLFRLLFPSAHQLSSAEVEKHLVPLVNRVYSTEKPTLHLAQKLVASLRDWIDGAHFYRHEPGTQEPAQPLLELAVYMLSETAGHLRWLAQLDAASQSSLEQL